MNPTALRYGWEDHPEVICGIAKAYATGKYDGKILLALVVDTGGEDPNYKRMQKHEQWERHAGTVLWIPAKMQVQTSGKGFRVDQMLTMRNDHEVEWADL